MIYVSSTRRGFTLIELLLYVAVASILLLSISLFAMSLIQLRIKDQTITEVEQQGAQAITLISANIRSARTITSPLSGATSTSLTLGTYISTTSPTVFSVSGGAISMQEGANPPVMLTNNRVQVSALTFQNVSFSNTPGIVRFQLTLSSVNPSGRNEYTYSKTFTTSASRRQP